MKFRQLFAILMIFSLLMCLLSCTKSDDSKECAACGKEYTAGMLYCPSCGEKITEGDFCSNGHKNEAGAKFCQECGVALTNNGETNGGNNENNNSNNNGQNIWLRVKSITSGQNLASQYYYNSKGELIAEKLYYTTNNKIDSIFNYSYDECGHLILKNTTYSLSGQMPLWTYTNKYDERGKLISVINNFSVVTEYKYDTNGMLSEKTEFSSGGSMNSREVYENGKIIAKYLEDNILYEEYFYDVMGRLEKYISYVTLWRYEGVDPVIQFPDTVFMGKRDNADDIPEMPDGVKEVHVEIRENTTTYIYDGNCNIVYEKQVSYYGNITERTHEYMSLADYHAQGLHNVLPTPNGDSDNNSGSNGGSNGGNSPSGVKCEWCQGEGRYDCKVSNCDDGIVPTGYDNPKHKICMVCHGEGTLECAHCGGDGIFGN